MRDLEKSVQLRQDLRMFYSERCLVEVLGPLQRTQETVRRLKGKVANGESRGQSCRRRGWGNVEAGLAEPCDLWKSQHSTVNIKGSPKQTQQDMEQNVASVFPEPQSSKWESGKGPDAGESASSHVHHTLSLPTANDRKERDYGKDDFESKNTRTSVTHTAHRVKREYLRL